MERFDSLPGSTGDSTSCEEMEEGVDDDDPSTIGKPDTPGQLEKDFLGETSIGDIDSTLKVTGHESKQESHVVIAEDDQCDPPTEVRIPKKRGRPRKKASNEALNAVYDDNTEPQKVPRGKDFWLSLRSQDVRKNNPHLEESYSSLQQVEGSTASSIASPNEDQQPSTLLISDKDRNHANIAEDEENSVNSNSAKASLPTIIRHEKSTQFRKRQQAVLEIINAAGGWVDRSDLLRELNLRSEPFSKVGQRALLKVTDALRDKSKIQCIGINAANALGEFQNRLVFCDMSVNISGAVGADITNQIKDCVRNEQRGQLPMLRREEIDVDVMLPDERFASVSAHRSPDLLKVEELDDNKPPLSLKEKRRRRRGSEFSAMPPKKRLKEAKDINVGTNPVPQREFLPRTSKNIQRATSQLGDLVSANDQDEYDEYEEDDSATQVTDTGSIKIPKNSRNWFSNKKTRVAPFAYFHHAFDSVNSRTRLGVRQLLGKTPYVVHDEHVERDEDVAESVLKACVLTSEKEFDPIHAKQVLQSMDPGDLVTAYSRLVDQGIIEQRTGDVLQLASSNGYSLKGSFFDSLRLRSSRVPGGLYTKAITFAEMIEEKLEKQDAIEILDSIDPGSMAVILDGLTNNTLELNLPDIDVSERGYQIKGYVSRSADRNRFDCRVILKSGRKKFRVRERPNLPTLDNHRIWENINGKTMEEWRTECRDSVLTAVLTSPGISLPILQSVFFPVLKEKDLSCILEFLVETGIIRGSEFGGYYVCSLY